MEFVQIGDESDSHETNDDTVVHDTLQLPAVQDSSSSSDDDDDATTTGATGKTNAQTGKSAPTLTPQRHNESIVESVVAGDNDDDDTPCDGLAASPSRSVDSDTLVQPRNDKDKDNDKDPSTQAVSKSHESCNATQDAIDGGNDDTDGHDGQQRPKKRRRPPPTVAPDTSPSSTSTSTHLWDDFVRKGTRLKDMLEGALEQMALYKASATTASTTNAALCREDQESAEGTQTVTSNSKRARAKHDMETTSTDTTPNRRSWTAHEHAAELAREKTAECMILQKKLQDAKVEAAALTATNEALRESSTSTSSRLQRTVEALRLAATNAANARADADAAEATATSLASQLEALRAVVQDTQRTARAVAKEHQDIAMAARLVETKLVQKETELVRSQKEQRHQHKERRDLQVQAEHYLHDCKSLEQQLHQQQQELHKHEKQANELKALEQARCARSKCMEQELYQARTMLSTASATAAETETTTSVLQETIHALQKENQTLHTRMTDIQNHTQKEQERLNDALTKSEKQAQSLKIEASGHEQDKQRLVMDKREAEKQVTQLKMRVANAERRLKDATFMLTPLDSLDQGSGTASSSNNNNMLSSRKTNGVSFSIPPLQQATPKTSKKNAANQVTPAACVAKSSTCCLCQQPALGFMKSCQCAGPSCDKRAHAQCLAKQQTKSVGRTSMGGASLVLCGATDAVKASS